MVVGSVVDVVVVGGVVAIDVVDVCVVVVVVVVAVVVVVVVGGVVVVVVTVDVVIDDVDALVDVSGAKVGRSVTTGAFFEISENHINAILIVFRRSIIKTIISYINKSH